MTVPVDIQALVGVKVYISATIPETYDAAGYQSTDFVGGWTQINKVGDIGPHGGTKNVTPFNDLATGTITKVAGSSDPGQMSLMCGYVNGDAGQALLKTAYGNNNTHYSIKVEYDDGTGAVTDEIHFMDVLVSQFEYTGGTSEAVRAINAMLTLCRAEVVVAPT